MKTCRNGQQRRQVCSTSASGPPALSRAVCGRRGPGCSRTGQTQLTQGIMPMWPSSCCGKRSMEPSGHRTDGGSPSRTGADHLAAHARGSVVSSRGANPMRGVPISVPYLCPDVAAGGAWMGGAESGGRERMLAGTMVGGRKQWSRAAASERRGK